MTARIAGLALAVMLAFPACADAADADPETTAAPPGTRNGREIYQRFREGLADPACEGNTSTRWQAHFAHAPTQMATRSDDVLPLFGYVVDSVRAASLPTEFALIPFVESGYKPGARSAQGPAGLWQMIAITARNHKVPMRKGYDGRLSPVDSTTAAVRYLKTLYGMFAGDWRLAVMAYNAGEYRVLGALKRGGQTARNATPETLPGLSPITHAYVRKLHALSCVLEQADDRQEWLQALNRPVPLLEPVTLPDGVTDVADWARQNGQDAATLRRLNPVFAGGRIATADGKPRLLAVAMNDPPPDLVSTGAVDNQANIASEKLAIAGAGASPSPTADRDAIASEPLRPDSDSLQATIATNPSPLKPAAARRHTVTRGDSLWKIAARYGIRVADLLQRNGLGANSVLRPGEVLLIDAEFASGDLPQTASTP